MYGELVQEELRSSDPVFDEDVRALSLRHRISILDMVNLIRSFAMHLDDPLEGKFMLHSLRETTGNIVYHQPLSVPDPYDPKVDIYYAFEDAVADAELSAKMLAEPCSIEDEIKIYLNSFKWMKFWAVREPSANRRFYCGLVADRWKTELEMMIDLASRQSSPTALAIVKGLRHVV